MKEPTVEINLPHVYKLVEATRDRTLDDNERETLKLVVDAVGQQVPPPPTRSSEKTRKVLKSEEPGRAKDGDEEKRGHGRHGADDFPGARRVDIPHQTLQVGCPCPECGKGKLRTGRRGPAPRVRFTGQPPIQGTVYGLERLECNLCDSTFTAEAPEEVGDEKYDASVTAVLAVFKYGRGIPFNRIEAIQAQAGIPLPASTQWEILEEDAQLVKPAYDEMTRQAAQAAVMHGDDTKVRILKVERSADDKRTGLHTTSIVTTPLSGDEGARTALYFSGTQHAGENLADLLQRRAGELDSPLLMADALAANTSRLSKEALEMVATCLDHSRRKVVELAEGFPAEARFFLEELGKVYGNDAEARRLGLDPQQRLRFHQQHSEQKMKKLRAWIEGLFAARRIEPNSPFGKALKYFVTHWSKLTLFLRHAGAPLANSICERAIKKAVLNRKNAMFYRTVHGAQVGDLYLSLIHTCELNRVNALEYLAALINNAVEVRRSPSAWMPWNYTAALPRGPD